MNKEQAKEALEWFDAFTSKFRYSEYCTNGDREIMNRVRELIERQTNDELIILEKEA